MVARTQADGLRPVVNVDMLNLDPSQRDGRRHEQMVELLVLLVEDVCVPLDGRDAGESVDFIEDEVEWREDRARHHEFVAVAADNDRSEGILLQNGLHESLVQIQPQPTKRRLRE